MRLSTLTTLLGLALSVTMPAFGDIAPNSGVVTPFQMEMSRSDLYTIISKSVGQTPISGQFSVPLDDLTVAAPFKAAVTGLALNVNYTIAPPALDPVSLQWAVKSSSISAELVIQKIDVTQVIHESVGAIQMDVHVNGACSQIHMSLPLGATQGSVVGDLDFSNRTPEFLFKSFAASWTPGSWKVTSLNCQGPIGLDALVRQNIETQLQKIDPYLQQLQTELQSFINQRLAQSLPLNLGPPPAVASSSAYAVSMTPQFYDLALPRASDSSKDFVRVSGSLLFAFPGLAADAGCAMSIPAFTDVPSQDVTENSLIVPFETVPALLKCAQLSKSLVYQFDSAGIGGFQKLEHSRLKQLAIWPDLIKFSEDTVFDFVASSETAPVISEQKSEGTHKIALNLTAPVDVDMSAPDHGVYVPYMHFTSPISGLAHVLIEGGHATFTIDKEAPFSMDHHWDAVYKSNHFINPIMIGGPIESATHDLLTTTGISVPLPLLNIAPGTVLSFEEGDVQDSNLKLRLAIAQAPPPAPRPALPTANTSTP